MTDPIHVAPVDAFDDGETRVVDADGLEVCVVRADGEFFALGNRCLHRGGPLHMGEVFPEVSEDFENADSGQRPELVYTDDSVITCPWHGWEYDLESGVHAGDPDVALPTFEVDVRDGDVYVEI